jgi:putative transposase
MFKQEKNKKLCEKILQDIAKRHKITITEMSVMPDHIHIIAQLPTTMSVSQAFHLLKGASSRELFKLKPNYRNRYPKGHFWSPGKFYRTVGDANVETVIQYVREQRLQQTTLNGFSTDSNSN